MSNELYKGIMNGLKEAVEFAKGKDTGATVYNPSGVKNIREKQKLSQSEFAKEFGLNINSLRAWDKVKEVWIQLRLYCLIL